MRRLFAVSRLGLAVAATLALLAVSFSTLIPAAGAASKNPCAPGWVASGTGKPSVSACQLVWDSAKPDGSVTIPEVMNAVRVRVIAVGGVGALAAVPDARVGQVAGEWQVFAGELLVAHVGGAGGTGDSSVSISRAGGGVSRAIAAGAATPQRTNEAPAGFASGFQPANSAAVSTVTLSYEVKGSLLGMRVFTQQGPTPFIASAFIDGLDPAGITRASFSVSPRPGASVPALTGSYSRQSLLSTGRIDAISGRLTVVVYGLYAGMENTVKLTVACGRSAVSRTLAIRTPAWEGIAAQKFASLEVLTPRDRSVHLDYSYMMLKYFASASSPVVLDVDGQPRWVGPDGNVAQAVAFDGTYFYLGDPTSAAITRLGLDGSSFPLGTYDDLGITGLHHNADPGKTGFIFEADRGREHIESTILEINRDGSVAGLWDLEKAIGDAMRAGGDDPSWLVRPGADWCHSNAAAYWPAQDQILVSCRELFVAALDYRTGALRWVLGDPTKHWHTYPSLRALSLAVTGNAPIGQHAVSLTSKNDLMLFDNGLASAQSLPGQSVGSSRTASMPRAYRLDLAKRTAKETWSFAHNPPIYSPVTSSVYKSGASLLVNFAAERWAQYVRLIGLGSSGATAFEYRWPSSVSLGWNALPVDLSKALW